MAQKLVKIKNIGKRKTYDIGIDTPEHLWLYKDLITKNSFNLPHSYAYSLMGYVQAWLKTYYPLEFWVSSLNTIEKGQEKHGQSSLGKYIYSIKRNGIKVVAPNVNTSGLEFKADKDGNIPFALSYIKHVNKGADNVIENKPYKNWDDFLEKAIGKKFNKSIVKGLVFSGACDFDDSIEVRPYKWLIYLAAKKGSRKNKKLADEISEFENNMPSYFELIEMEYDYCKYSFTGLDNIKAETKYKNIKTISERDMQKKLWSLLGYVSSINTKTSKKSKNRYLLITVTDFRDMISIFAFGDEYRDKILGNFKKGDVVKIGVKNDGGWFKLPWEKEFSGKFPIEKINI